jgi:hypothetical protein
VGLGWFDRFSDERLDGGETHVCGEHLRSAADLREADHRYFQFPISTNGAQ